MSVYWQPPNGPGQAVGKFGTCGLSMVNRTYWTFVALPVGVSTLNLPRLAAVKVPSWAVAQVLPSADVSILYCPVDELPGSPQTFDGSTLNERSEERRVGKECRPRWSTDH